MQIERSEVERGDLRSGSTARHRRAYTKAVEQHYTKIFAFLYHMAQNADLAADLTQETFAIAWQNLDRFEGRSSLQVWLHSIALNAFRTHLRSSGPEEEPMDDDSPSTGPSAIDHLETAELRQRAQEAVAKLPVIYREVVVLHCYQGLKYREIAELLNVPQGTVQARSHVAFQKLRAQFQEVGLDG